MEARWSKAAATAAADYEKALRLSGYCTAAAGTTRGATRTTTAAASRTMMHPSASLLSTPSSFPSACAQGLTYALFQLHSSVEV